MNNDALYKIEKFKQGFKKKNRLSKKGKNLPECIFETKLYRGGGGG
jgi:hypothetical protein